MSRLPSLLTVGCFALSVSIFAQAPIRDNPPPPAPAPEPLRTLTLPSEPVRTEPPGTQPDATTTDEIRHSDLGATWTVRLGNRAGQPSPRNRSDDRIRLRVNRPAPTDTSHAPPLPINAPRPLVIEEQRDPAKVTVGQVAKFRLTLQDLDRMLELARGNQSFAGTREERGELRRKQARRILGDWVDTKLLVTEALARGIEVTKAEMEKYLHMTAEDRLLRDPGFVEQRRRSLDITEEELNETLRDAILGDKLIRAEIRRRITDEELQQTYQDRSYLFWTPPERHVRQIFYPYQGTETQKDLRKMEKEMKKIRRDLKWFGGKFEDYIDPTGTSGIFATDLGWLGLGEAINPRRQIIYALVFATERADAGEQPKYRLKVGEYSDVLQSPYGYHIIEVVEDRPARQQTFEEAKVVVENRFYDKVRDQLLAELRIKYQPNASIYGLEKDAEKRTRTETASQEPQPETVPLPLPRPQSRPEFPPREFNP